MADLNVDRLLSKRAINSTLNPIQYLLTQQSVIEGCFNKKALEEIVGAIDIAWQQKLIRHEIREKLQKLADEQLLIIEEKEKRNQVFNNQVTGFGEKLDIKA